MKKVLFVLTLQIITIHAQPLGNGHEVPLELLQSILPDNPVILEAGAHYAQDTCWMAQTWPCGIIHAFEPTPVNFARVHQSAQQFSNVKCYTYALDYECGTKLFFQDGDGENGNQGANSLLPHKILKKSVNEPIVVECLTIDAWAEKMNVSNIDFMWLDIEGNELNALKGALHILPTVKAIFTEVNFQEFWHGAVQYDMLKAWLKQHNFKEVWRDVKANWNGNVLFVRE